MRARLLPAFALVPALLLGSVAPTRADRVAQSSGFGPNTVTLDTDTGLRWLDVTLSTSRTYAEVVAGLGAGGEFDGFRLAEGDEVATLFENAGINMSTTAWTAVNYAPIVALAALVGQTSANGNCGSGCNFFETKGWIDNGPPVPPPQFYSSANIRWFDNDPPQTTSVSFPQDEIGSQIYSTHSDSDSPLRGAWLVEAPEADFASLGMASLLAIAGIAARRRGSSLRR